MISEEQMKHILEAQQASFMALLTEMQRNWGPASRENKRKQIEQRITEFAYDPEGGVNFEAWFRKYEGLFEEKGAELDDKTKVEIILLKLAQREHERKEQLYITEDCIMYDGKVVIPTRYQQQVLRELHAGHQGMTRMKQLARKYVYWPGIDNDVESFVRSCGPCGREAKNPPKVPPVPWPEVTRPWSRVHMDFAGPFFNRMFLIVVDAWSKWLEVFDVSAATADITARKTEELIARYGIPTEIVTDNGTQFTSSIFQQLCQKWGIRHVTSPPFHPQSNGQAERFVDTFKRAMKKMWNSGVKLEYLNTFLFAYRTNPKSDLGGQTPAERFLGRQPDTRLQYLQPEARVPQTTKYYFREGEEVFARNYKAGEKPWIEVAGTDNTGITAISNVAIDTAGATAADTAE
nr:unnamed protein product [Spirometra erinaceieuropaei]